MGYVGRVAASIFQLPEQAINLSPSNNPDDLRAWSAVYRGRCAVIPLFRR